LAWGREFEPHDGCRDYLKNKISLKILKDFVDCFFCCAKDSKQNGRGLVSKICKELIKLNTQRPNNAVKKCDIHLKCVNSGLSVVTNSAGQCKVLVPGKQGGGWRGTGNPCISHSAFL